MPGKTETIRNLNDALRTGRSSEGRIMITQGVQALGAFAIGGIRDAVARFDAFDPDNDPHGEHDFGAIDFEGSRIFWKIDAYDRQLEFGSPDPADPKVTARVLTILLAEEY